MVYLCKTLMFCSEVRRLEQQVRRFTDFANYEEDQWFYRMSIEILNVYLRESLTRTTSIFEVGIPLELTTG